MKSMKLPSASKPAAQKLPLKVASPQLPTLAVTVMSLPNHISLSTDNAE
jgi:hypothetical protein